MAKSTRQGWSGRRSVLVRLGIVLTATALACFPSIARAASAVNATRMLSIDTASKTRGTKDRDIAFSAFHTLDAEATMSHLADKPNGLSPLVGTTRATSLAAAKQWASDSLAASPMPAGPSSLHLLALGLVLVPIARKLGLTPR